MIKVVGGAKSIALSSLARWNRQREANGLRVQAVLTHNLAATDGTGRRLPRLVAARVDRGGAKAGDHVDGRQMPLRKTSARQRQYVASLARPDGAVFNPLAQHHYLPTCIAAPPKGELLSATVADQKGALMAIVRAAGGESRRVPLKNAVQRAQQVVITAETIAKAVVGGRRGGHEVQGLYALMAQHIEKLLVPHSVLVLTATKLDAMPPHLEFARAWAGTDVATLREVVRTGGIVEVAAARSPAGLAVLAAGFLQHVQEGAGTVLARERDVFLDFGVGDAVRVRPGGGGVEPCAAPPSAACSGITATDWAFRADSGAQHRVVISHDLAMLLRLLLRRGLEPAGPLCPDVPVHLPPADGLTADIGAMWRALSAGRAAAAAATMLWAGGRLTATTGALSATAMVGFALESPEKCAPAVRQPTRATGRVRFYEVAPLQVRGALVRTAFARPEVCSARTVAAWTEAGYRCAPKEMKADAAMAAIAPRGDAEAQLRALEKRVRLAGIVGFNTSTNAIGSRTPCQLLLFSTGRDSAGRSHCGAGSAQGRPPGRTPSLVPRPGILGSGLAPGAVNGWGSSTAPAGPLGPAGRWQAATGVARPAPE